jgi:hypothetical protein
VSSRSNRKFREKRYSLEVLEDEEEIELWKISKMYLPFGKVVDGM